MQESHLHGWPRSKLLETAYRHPEICFLESIEDDMNLPGPRVTCTHGRTLHMNLARRALGLEPLDKEELDACQKRLSGS